MFKLCVSVQYTCNTVAENYLGSYIALVNFYFKLLSAWELRLAIIKRLSLWGQWLMFCRLSASWCPDSRQISGPRRRVLVIAHNLTLNANNFYRNKKAHKKLNCGKAVAEDFKIAFWLMPFLPSYSLTLSNITNRILPLLIQHAHVYYSLPLIHITEGNIVVP